MEINVYAPHYIDTRQNFTAFQNEFVNKLKDLEDNKQMYYVCGGININLIKSSTNNGIKYYFDEIISVDSQVLIDKPTRIMSNSASLVDHIYCNDPTSKFSPCISMADMSDHCQLMYIYLLRTPF